MSPTAQPHTPTVLPRAGLPGAPEAPRFIGADHGGVAVSMFLIDSAPGAGPALHRHPYDEVFVVHGGRAEFRVDDDVLVASGGEIVIAPAGSAHRFVNAGPGRLTLTAIHTAPRMETEWLESRREDHAR